MRKTKKLVTTLLIPSVIATTVLSGCGGNGGNTQTTTPASTTASSGGSTTAAGDTTQAPSDTPWELLDAKTEEGLTVPRSNYLTYPVDSSEATQTLKYWLPTYQKILRPVMRQSGQDSGQSRLELK